MANIYDIAKESGVSKSTVSRVINDKPGVSDKKRKTVLKVIDELNYKPNSAARTLGLKRTNTIGVLVNDLSDTFYSAYVRMIDRIFTNKFHYGALYCTTNKSTPTKVNYLKQLNKMVDGYMFLGEEVITKDELKTLKKDNEPFVGIGTNIDFEKGTMVDINNFEASYDLVKYLIDLGHKNILYVASEINRTEFSERFMGYQKALMENDLPYQDYFTTDFSIDKSYRLAKEINLSIKENDITAIVCFNDMAACGVMDGLIDLGYEIPKDLSVVGFDNYKGHMKIKNKLPKLTTMEQPNKEMASYGVKALYDQIVNNKSTESKIFKCKLIKGSSTKKI
ncbi:MAG: LacI family DNA-binding transcriptional regulator [Bacillota bacterium]